MVRFKTAMMRFKVCENDSFYSATLNVLQIPTKKYYDWMHSSLCLKQCQTTIYKLFFFPWFTGALRCVWVRLVYIILDYDYKLYSRRHCSPYTVYLDFSGDWLPAVLED